MLYDVIRTVAHSAPLAPLREGFAGGAQRQWLSGVRGTGKSLAIAALIQARREQTQPRVQFILTPSQERAETLFTDLTALFGRNGEVGIVLCPSLESLLYEETSPDLQLIRERITVLSRLATAAEPLVVIATPDAALHRTLPPAVLRASSRTIHVNEEADPAALAAWLVAAGYNREGMTEAPGQFSLRGGVLDIYPSTEDTPIRLEFFGDEIDSLRAFDPGTQRSKQAQAAEKAQTAKDGRKLLPPTKEQLADPQFYRTETLDRKPAQLGDGQWHRLRVAINGNAAEAKVDEVVLRATGSVFDVKKSRLVFLIGLAGTMQLDNVKVWEH